MITGVKYREKETSQVKVCTGCRLFLFIFWGGWEILLRGPPVLYKCAKSLLPLLHLQDIFASLTVVADGCFSKFRKDLVAEVPIVKSHFVGMIMENCPQARSNHAGKSFVCQLGNFLNSMVQNCLTRRTSS